MGSWVFDRRLQTCDDDELKDLIEQLLALQSEKRTTTCLLCRARLLARLELVKQEIALRGVQLRFFD